MLNCCVYYCGGGLVYVFSWFKLVLWLWLLIFLLGNIIILVVKFIVVCCCIKKMVRLDVDLVFGLWINIMVVVGFGVGGGISGL